MKGKVKMWKPKEGYGFIGRESGPDVFVHANDIVGAIRELVPGDTVQFEMGTCPKGPKAVNVRVIK